MKNRMMIWGGTGALLMTLGSVLCFTNPAISEYRDEILVPAAQERHSSSDALLASILQSLPTSSSQSSISQSHEGSSGELSVLLNRTKRENFAILSVYSTEFDYCEGNQVSRSVGKTLGIAGRFYVLQVAACPSQSMTSS